MEKDKLRKKFGNYAKENNIKLNPDKKIVNGVLMGLIKNKERKGEIYCPCRIPIEDKKEDKKIICPCALHLGEIKKDGYCKCNLFVK